MPCPILDNPAEIKLGIIEALQANGTFQDWLNLSCTCQSFRELFIPEIFKSIVLRNDEKSAATIQAIVDAGYGHHVKELHYKGKHAIPHCDYEELAEDDQLDEEEMGNLLPSSVAEILSDLSLLPNLEGLVIEFPFGDWKDGLPHGEWTTSFYNFDDEESEEEVGEREATYGWRAIMVKSWNAIVQNQHPKIKSLELKGTVAKGVSTWSSQSFRDFLTPIEDFKISIRGNDNGAGWCINTLDGYHFFLQNLGTYFFNHLPNVATFSLHASDSGPIGLEGMHHSPTPLTPTSLPHLKSLNLEYIFIDPPLVTFITSHAKNIEAISLVNCMAGITGLSENGITWHRFSTSLVEADPANLRSFEILPVEVEGVGNGQDVNQYGSIEMFRKAEKIMREDETRRAFPYKILDDKYGMLFDDEDVNLEKFLEGEDQRGFDALEEIVVRNRGKE